MIAGDVLAFVVAAAALSDDLNSLEVVVAAD